MLASIDPLREVDSLMARRRYGRAAELLRAAIAERPEDTSLRLRLADVLTAAGERGEAANLLERVGRELAADGFTAKAIAVWKRLQKLRPDASEIEQALADLIRERDEQIRDAPAKPVGAGPEAPPLPEGVARSPLFSQFSAAELAEVIRGLRLATWSGGDLLVSEGEPGGSLFVLASGEARVFVQGLDRRNREVRRLVSGDFFGEISLLTGSPRTATIVAAGACETLELDRSAVIAIAGRHPAVRATIQRFCLERSESVEERSARAGEAPFEPFVTDSTDEPVVPELGLDAPPRLALEEVAAIVPFCQVRTFAAGESIFRRGDPGDRMYVVEAGEVELRFDHARPPKRLAVGEMFGELALVTPSRRRTATAAALSDLRLIVVDRDAYGRLRGERPELLVGLLERSCTYLVDSEQKLIGDLRRRARDLERALDFLQRTKEELSTIEARALTDDLTGIYNRRCFEEQIRRSVERAQASDQALALLLIDVDRFKLVNDTLGHMVGDLVLRRLAQLLRGSVRWTDLPCRIGGDEFAVIWTDLDGGSAERRARALAPAVATFELAGAPHALRVTASLGGALLRADESWKQLFERADRGLYLAKKAGRGRLAWDERLADAGDASA
jgi:diguanylate cyclase (GGDEF)-like protein